MQRMHLRFGKGFKVLMGTRLGQAAQMTIAPGESEGGPNNRHGGAEQYLFVVSGRGVALINSQPVPLRAGSLLLIEKGERHQIRNTGRTPLRTLNFYTPPAYTASGKERPPARPKGQ